MASCSIHESNNMEERRRPLKTEHQHRIEQFMKKAGQIVHKKPTIPGVKTRKLRAKLILEEAFETVKALGFNIIIDIGTGELELVPNEDGCNIIEVADGCADISVVTIGTLSAFGIHDKPLLEEVDDSNLRKFGTGSYKRSDGKWMKPADWTPPDIEKILKNISV